MSAYKEILANAHEDGLINEQQLELLTERFAGLPSDTATDVGTHIPNNLKDELDQPVYMGQDDAPAETEAPRFVRGFHDILITCGLVIACLGLASLVGGIGVVIAAWFFSEILVRRQRLALPAVVLTLAYFFGLASFIFPYLWDQIGRFTFETNIMLGIGSIALMLFPYYWRFRVPIALSMMIISCVGFAMSMILLIASHLLDLNELYDKAPLLFSLVLLFGSVMIFLSALWFDQQDLTRVKRWSDVAFWLHLVAAPNLLFSLVTLLVADQNTLLWWFDTPTLYESAVVLGCVFVMLFIGIVIDRRAFVTSGLISFIAAVGALFNELELQWGDATSVALLVVGLFVLTFGVGWTFLRRFILGLLPPRLCIYLPPVQSGTNKR